MWPPAARRALPFLVLAVVIAGGTAWWARHRGPAPEPAGMAARRADPTALTDDAIRLYAAGQLARACDRFSEAAGARPGSTARREDVGRCFETWGWRTLAQGRPDEAALLFGQGLAALPDDPALLKGAGVAAVHAGRAGDALGPLEAAARHGHDAQVHVLLARLYDHRDDPERAVAHLRALLATDPGHAEARALLDKLEREQRTESAFVREPFGAFVLRYRPAADPESRRAVKAALEQARRRVVAQLGDAGPERVAVVLYDRGQFSDVTRTHAWVSGLFDGRIRLPLGAALPPRAELERLLTHEYAHAVIHRQARGRAPRWLQEGLAQALEGRLPDPALGAAGGLTLQGLEALVTDPDPRRAHAGYELALFVVADLLDRGDMEAMRALLARLGAGETMAEAAPRVYGWRLVELESQWRRLLGG
ncbi:MAG TPA: tetratricopeptide repeat protein [Methylomirabilota bacterium]|nr:tetratricopeptide repeat protein [Methylomirabilota bacterium]